MDTAAFVVKGGENGPGIKPGKASESLLIQALKGTHDDISQMPYKKPPLKPEQIALIEKWVDEGAKAPADEAPESGKHWAFIPPAPVVPPQVNNSNWVHNAIDHFILARLEKEKISPAPPADRITLLRRVTLDLTGLLPTPAEVTAFLNDPRPTAYRQVVERLLSSERYGERWGRFWLDVARYADSNGYSIDAPRSIWPYRDWVIKALNQDLPFDQFTIEQLAGDLLPKPTLDQKIATGFNRNTQINQEGGIDPEQFRVESVMDRVNTTATAFLGLTLACAQCHDHKFDPLTQKEYYQFYAFFNNTIEDGHGKGAPEGMLEIPGELEAPENQQKELEEAEADLERFLDTKGSELVKLEEALSVEEKAKLKPEVAKILEVPFAQRDRKQKRLAYLTFRGEDNDFKTRNAKLTKLEKRQPKPVTTLVMVERPEQRKSTVFIKGDFTRPGDAVQPGVPAIMNPLKALVSATNTSRKITASTSTDTLKRELQTSLSSAPQIFGAPIKSKEGESDSAVSKTTNAVSGLGANRLDLARWIVDPANPLTARVTVNRVWQQYFGRGIVETENDFGTQGIPPTHPELLDWLAQQLISRGWSLKELHRLIVLSATYQQSSKVRPDLAVVDPVNKLLARQTRLRLDAEVVRDVSLSASGLLSAKLGGPGVFPPQPAGVMNLGQSRRDWKPSTGSDRYRRGVYTFFWRATPHPALMVFDSPDAFSSCTRRARSNTPLQALTLLNDEAFHEFAQGLAARVLSAPSTSDDQRLERAFEYCFARTPKPEEKKRLSELLQMELRRSTGEPAAVQKDAWTMVSRVLLNLDEFITRE